MVGIPPVGPGSTPAGPLGPLDPQKAQELQNISKVLEESSSPQTDPWNRIRKLEEAIRALERLLHDSNLSPKEKEKLSHELRKARHYLDDAKAGLAQHPSGDWQVRHQIDLAQKEVAKVLKALGK